MEQYYSFATLDPRRTEAASIANDALLGETTLGVEVTIPELASRCGLGNIDPQHTGGDASRAAIEVVADLTIADLPPAGSTLVTVRPDLDSVASMAILDLKASGGLNLPADIAVDVVHRIKDIAVRDRWDRGGWPGQRPLPTTEAPWSDDQAPAAAPTIAALAAAVADFKIPLGDRVSIMKDYLVSGALPEKYQTQVTRDRQAMIQALADGSISVETKDSGDLPVAIVHSTHRAGTSIGYLLAPVVVAINPEFQFQGGESHRKVTICQFTNGYLNLPAIAKELNALEPGWGGSPTIIGSPQGEASHLSVAQILAVIENHRTPHQ